MVKMLQLVKQKVENHAIDITLKFTLSALWNLTGNSYVYVYYRNYFIPENITLFKFYFPVSEQSCVQIWEVSVRK